jgi:hypothetical protein
LRSQLNKILSKFAKCQNEDIIKISKKLILKFKKLIKATKVEESKSPYSDNTDNHDSEISKIKNEINARNIDKLRKTTTILLIDTITKMLEPGNNIDYNSINAIITEIEEKLHKMYPAKDKYIKKTKSIVVNLTKNSQLVENILSQQITPEAFVQMDEKVYNKLKHIGNG